jgi:ssDNA-binding Zn-finger/Zn-ribbon topoisomerase 1
MSEKDKRFADNLESEVLCPDCRRKLIVKTNHLNEGQFLGCPNYPECRYTQPIPEAWRMRLAGQQELGL